MKTDLLPQDEEGDLILNQAAVRDYVADLAEKYNTKGTDRTFMSTSGKEIHFDAESGSLRNHD